MAEIAEILGFACIPTFIAWDLISRYRKFSTPRFWRPRALVVSGISFSLSIYVTWVWGDVLEGVRLLEGRKLGIVGGALIGILVYELVHYWYHRAAHRLDWRWRWAHQMHHSAESVDATGAYHLHPVDTFFFTTWSILVFFPLLGLQPEAGALAGAFLTANAMFQHANSRLPDGSAISFSARKATAFTMNAASTGTTTRICPSGTSSSGRSEIPSSGGVRRDSTTALPAESGPCCSAVTSRRRPSEANLS